MAVAIVVVEGCSVKLSCVPVPGLMVKNALVAEVRPEALAVSLYPTAALSIDRPENVATPATAATVVVPDSVAPGAPVPPVIASVTFPVKLDAVSPEASRATTTMEGEREAPAVAGSGGCTVKNR